MRNKQREQYAGSVASRIHRVGFDFGDTIVNINRDQSQAFRSESPWEAKTYPDAIYHIRCIAGLIGPTNMHIISRIKSDRALQATKAWLERNDFYSSTGLRPENVYFCSERYEKAAIAASRRLDCFVDNRPDVLFHLRDVVPHRLLFCPDWSDYNEEDIQEIEHGIKGVETVDSWKDVHRYVLSNNTP